MLDYTVRTNWRWIAERTEQLDVSAMFSVVVVVVVSIPN